MSERLLYTDTKIKRSWMNIDGELYLRDNNINQSFKMTKDNINEKLVQMDKTKNTLIGHNDFIDDMIAFFKKGLDYCP